jgi:hypothetical protein
MSNAEMPAGHLIQGAAWCETFGEFTDWLDDAGVTVEGLPSWPPNRPVRVLATPPARLLLEKIGRQEYRHFQRMVERDEVWIRPLPKARIADMHEVKVTDVDTAKLQAWQRRKRQGVTA